MIFSKSNKRFGEIFSFKMKDTILNGGGGVNYYTLRLNKKYNKFISQYTFTFVLNRLKNSLLNTSSAT